MVNLQPDGAPTSSSWLSNRPCGSARTVTGAAWPGSRTTPTTAQSHLSIRYADRLLSEGIEASTGAVGSSYGNAAAEALNKSYECELIWTRSWKARDDLKAATASWVDWYNHTRPHRTNPDELPPVAVEARYYDHTTTSATVAA